MKAQLSYPEIVDTSINPYMSLKKLLDGIICLPEHLDRDILDIQCNNKLVKEGALFCACPGANSDGRDYIQLAISAGAHAIISQSSNAFPENKVSTILQNQNTDKPIPHIQVNNLREKISLLASRFYQHPSKHMQMIGVTGTNGKSSVAFAIAMLLKNLKFKPGFIGTHGIGVDLDQLSPSELTTPDAISLQQSLSKMNDYI